MSIVTVSKESDHKKTDCFQCEKLSLSEMSFPGCIKGYCNEEHIHIENGGPKMCFKFSQERDFKIRLRKKVLYK